MIDEWTAPELGLKAALGFALENRDGRSIPVLEISGVHLNPNGVVHGAVPFTDLTVVVVLVFKLVRELGQDQLAPRDFWPHLPPTRID